MPNTIPAAGEAMTSTTLEDMIARHNAALEAANKCNGPLEDSPEEVELHAAVDAFVDSTAKLASYAGVLDALRLAVKENEDFESSSVGVTAVKGALEFLEAREAELPVTRADHLARELSETMAQWLDGTFMALVYPANHRSGYWFRNISTIDDHDRLRELTSEVARILATKPELGIDNITINKDGIYTGFAIDGLDHFEPDPIIGAIHGFQESLEAFNAIPEDKLSDDEDRHVAETYGPWIDKLYAWDQPIRSVEGALEAVKLMQTQQVFCDELGKVMAQSVVSFLEGARS